MNNLAHPKAPPVANEDALAIAHNNVTEARFRAMLAWFGKRPLCEIDAGLLAHAQFPLIAGDLDDAGEGRPCAH